MDCDGEIVPADCDGVTVAIGPLFPRPTHDRPVDSAASDDVDDAAFSRLERERLELDSFSLLLSAAAGAATCGPVDPEPVPDSMGDSGAMVGARGDEANLLNKTRYLS